jgi:hypothetical protein
LLIQPLTLNLKYEWATKTRNLIIYFFLASPSSRHF